MLLWRSYGFLILTPRGRDRPSRRSGSFSLLRLSTSRETSSVAICDRDSLPLVIIEQENSRKPLVGSSGAPYQAN